MNSPNKTSFIFSPPTDEQINALLDSITYQLDDTLEGMLKNRPDCIDWKLSGGDTALIRAAAHGNPTQIKMLLAAGADSEQKNDRKMTALDAAQEYLYRLSGDNPAAPFVLKAHQSSALLEEDRIKKIQEQRQRDIEAMKRVFSGEEAFEVRTISRLQVKKKNRPAL